MSTKITLKNRSEIKQKPVCVLASAHLQIVEELLMLTREENGLINAI